MSLDPRFVTGEPLQDYFVDKDTGEALAGGVVTFYEDENRTVLKPVYQLSGSPPYDSASYVELNNPITLTSVGTFADNNGDDIIPYYFPYDGTPDDSNGDIELYYITVYSSGGVLQFTREAWPNISDSNPGSPNDIINYVANGQFLLHNDNPITSTSGLDTIYQVAPGGWTFEKTTASTSTDTITFERELSASTNPNEDANPRYFIQIASSVPSGDARKDLCLEFPDVNKFAGDPNDPDSVYTFSFQGLSVLGAPVMVDVRLIKYFGTGGSTSTDISLGTLTINPTESIYNISFTFGDNAGMNVGTTLDDDYLKIALRFPNGTQTVKLTDFVLTNGDITVEAFPQTTNAEFLEASTVGWLPTPNPDGSDLYLPLVLTQAGATYDTGTIGQIVAMMDQVVTSVYTDTNLLLCDGSAYLTTDYSPLGIPYSRLWNKIYNTTDKMPIFGTGTAFVSLYNSGAAVKRVIFTTNGSGAQTAPSNGSTSPNLNFNAFKAGVSPTYKYNAYSNSSNFVTVISTFASAGLDGPSAGTSTMTITADNTNHYFNLDGYYKAFTITTVAASTFQTGGVGLYFDFSNDATLYRFWFDTGTEVAPAAGGRTLVRIIIDSTFLAADVAKVLANALSGFQVYEIDFDTATLPVPQNSWWQFTAHSNDYFAWYNVDGAGTQPVGTGTPIEIAVTSAETAQTLATKTVTALNSYQFAVPDLRGVFLRGLDSGGIWDINHSNRWNINNINSPNRIGSMELDQYLKHEHSVAITDDGVTAATFGSGSAVANGTGLTNANGGAETRPVNMYVNYAIRY